MQITDTTQIEIKSNLHDFHNHPQSISIIRLKSPHFPSYIANFTEKNQNESLLHQIHIHILLQSPEITINQQQFQSLN